MIEHQMDMPIDQTGQECPRDVFDRVIGSDTHLGLIANTLDPITNDC
jgi:hypothetical protein